MMAPGPRLGPGTRVGPGCGPGRPGPWAGPGLRTAAATLTRKLWARVPTTSTDADRRRDNLNMCFWLYSISEQFPLGFMSLHTRKCNCFKITTCMRTLDIYHAQRLSKSHKRD